MQPLHCCAQSLGEEAVQIFILAEMIIWISSKIYLYNYIIRNNERRDFINWRSSFISVASPDSRKKEINLGLCDVFFFMFNAFIFWNNSGCDKLTKTFNFHAVSHVLRRPRPQDAGTPSFLAVFTSESDSGPGKGLHRQSDLPQSLHRLFATAIFFIQLYSAIAMLARCPRTQGYRKEPTFPH
jgi:hypothetical protein